MSRATAAFFVDTWLVRAVPRVRPLDGVVRAVGNGGAGGIAWALAAGAAGHAEDGRRGAARGAVAPLAAYATSVALARLIGRRRPCRRGHARAVGRCPDSPSFPSDQAAASFAGAAFIARALPRGARPAFAAAAIVAAARVYLGVHYATDVIGGAMIGRVIAARLRHPRA